VPISARTAAGSAHIAINALTHRANHPFLAMFVLLK
jgi:hypothetical protein